MTMQQIQQEVKKFIALPDDQKEPHLQGLANSPDGVNVIRILYKTAKGIPDSALITPGTGVRLAMIPEILKHDYTK